MVLTWNFHTTKILVKGTFPEILKKSDVITWRDVISCVLLDSQSDTFHFQVDDVIAHEYFVLHFFSVK